MCYDAIMPRTTLAISDDALRLAKRHAKERDVSLGTAVSDLIRKGFDRPIATDVVNGLHVIRLRKDSPVITQAMVDEMLEDWP